MPDPIKIVVQQETQGNALKEAVRDEERLQQANTAAATNAEKRADAEERVAKAKKEQAQSQPQGPSRPEPVIRDYATQPAGTAAASAPQRVAVDFDAIRASQQAAAAAMDADSRRIASTGTSSDVDERSVIREAAYTTALEARQARAEGRNDEAQELEREAQILTRTLQIQKQINVSVAEARVLAVQEAEADAQIARAKEAQAAVVKQQKADAAAVHAEARARSAEEQKITKEKREQDRLQVQQGRFVLNAGRALGSGAIAMSGVLAEDYFARQQIVLRDQAARASDARARKLQAERGYSSDEAVAHLRGTEDEIFNLQQQRPMLENQKKSGMFVGGIAGVAGGALTGGQIGGPIGALIGAIVGAGAGVYRGYLGGNRALEENDAQTQKAQDELVKAKEDQRKRFELEVAPESEILRKTMQGDRRGARALQEKILLEKEYQSLLKRNASEEEAREGAALSIAERRRQQAGSFAGLVNARSGARDVAAAASAAAYSSVGPAGLAGVDGLKKTLDGMHQTMRSSHNEAMNARPFRDFL